MKNSSSQRFCRNKMLRQLLIITSLMAMASISSVDAQNRAIGAREIMLDDGSGHVVTILPPPGMTGNYIYTLPSSPGATITSGYVAMGNAAGQTLSWNGSYWAPSTSLLNTGSGISLSGTFFANGSAGSAGQILTINGAGNPVWATISGTGSVTSVDVSGGTTGLTTSNGPITAAGTITLGGTLALANGGTGATTQAAAINNLLPGQAGNGGMVLSTNGSNVSWIAASGSGTVTSVAIAAPPEFSVSGSPILTAGTITISKANQSANSIYAGPTSGAAAQPMFRALVSLDIPNNSANTTGSAGSFTGSISGDVTGIQTATVVSSVGGSTAADVHAAEVAANGATNANTAFAIVKRDASGNFSADTISANLDGNATTSTLSATSTNFTGSLSGDVTGTQSATVVSSVGGSSEANVHSSELSANAATDANTASTIVKRDASGNFSAGTITAMLSGNATNVTGTVGIGNGGTGQTSANNGLNALLPTQTGNASKVLETNGSNTSWATIAGAGTVTSIDISGGTTGLTTTGGPITGSGTITIAGMLALANGGTGAATQAGAVNNLLPAQAGNSGKVLESDGTNISWQTAGGSGTVTSVAISAPSEFSVTGSPITTAGTLTLSKANQLANTVYAGPTAGGSGQPSFRVLTSNDIPNNAANTTGTSSNFTGSLSGDVTGTQSATVVSSVGGSSAANVHAAELAANAGTNANMASTIVRRDASGNFSADTISANVNGNATTSTSSITSTNFTGSLSGDVTGTQSATVVSSVGGSSAANIHAAELAANAATNANSASTIIRRDAAGNFSADTISANLNGNATTSTSSITSTNFTGSLSGDVTGTQSATVISSVGGSSAANIHAAELAANAATNANKASAIVKRDPSGNFSADTIMAALHGNATGTAANVTGTVALTNGGTGATTAGGALNNLLPSQSGNSGKVLETDGTNASWQSGSSGGSGWGLSGNSLAGTEFIGSTNAQPLILKTNDTERIRIVSGGDVGIGTTSPSQALEVKNGNILLSNGGSASQLQFQGTSTGVSSFQAGAQGSTSIHYTLPASAASTSGQSSSLMSDGSGNLSWSNIGQIKFARKTGNQDYTSTSLTTDTNLSIALDTSGIYAFEAFLSFTDESADGTDGKMAFTVPAGSTIKFGWANAAGPALINSTVVNTSGSATNAMSIVNGNSSYETFVHVQGIVLTSTTSGNLLLKCERVGGTTLRLQANSYLMVTRVH